MKTFLATLAVLISLPLFGQSANQNNFGGLAAYKAAGLPSPAGKTGMTVVVTDALSQGNCTSGGGVLLAFCYSNGTIWQPLGDGGTGGATTLAPVTSGLIAQYAFTDNTGTTAADSSGNSNTATFPGGANNPNWIGTPTGGISFGANKYLPLPVAITPAKTIQIFYSFQSSLQPTNSRSVIYGNGTVFIDYYNNQYYQHANAGDLEVSNLKLDVAAASAYPIVVNGTQLLTLMSGFTTDSTIDRLFLGPNEWTTTGTLSSKFGDNQSGTSNLSMNDANLWFPGNIYYALFYNRRLSVAEIAQNAAVVNQILANRGVTPIGGFNTAAVDNQFIGLGDSITFGGSTVPYTDYLSLNSGTWKIANIGYPSEQAVKIALDLPVVGLPAISPTTGRSVVALWSCTNDMGPGSRTLGQCLASLKQISASIRAAGAKVIVASMISRTTFDANKNSFNPVLRNLWPTIADGFVDIASDPDLGADGANASSTYFMPDHVHPSGQAQANNDATMIGRAVNRLYGNNNWTTANTYTTTAPAATAITATSEATNTVTVTSTLNPGVGSCVVIAGVTPAGYNSAAGDCWNVLSSSSTTFTYYNGTTGLGAGTVFGTAIIPTQLDADVYTVLGGSATSPSFTLESCRGFTGQNLYLKNTNTTSPWVITPFTSAETIDGATTLTMPTASSGNNPVVVLQAQLVSNTAGGCTWKRLQ